MSPIVILLSWNEDGNFLHFLCHVKTVGLQISDFLKTIKCIIWYTKVFFFKVTDSWSGKWRKPIPVDKSIIYLAVLTQQYQKTVIIYTLMSWQCSTFLPTSLLILNINSPSSCQLVSLLGLFKVEGDPTPSYKQKYNKYNEFIDFIYLLYQSKWTKTVQKEYLYLHRFR